MSQVFGTNTGFCAEAPTVDPATTLAYMDNNNCYAIKHTSPAAANRVTEIGFFCDSTADSWSFEVGLYDSTGSANNEFPDDVVDWDKGGTTGSGKNWYSVTGLNIVISGSTLYWIAIYCDSGSYFYGNYANIGSFNASVTVSGSTLPDPWNSTSGDLDYYVYAFYAVYESGEAPEGTNAQINIGDDWKSIAAMKINIGDDWKAVAGLKINIGDDWKTIF